MVTVKELIKKHREYLDYIEEHYDNVQKAWKLINDKCQNKGFRFIYDDFVWGTIDHEVKMHDATKLSMFEFSQYRQWFFPIDGEHKDKVIFDEAWEHHKTYNEHHWENWSVNHANNPYGDAFVVMMVVDWMAMGFKFGDTAKEYYEKNCDKIVLPDWAVKTMYEIFGCVYE